MIHLAHTAVDFAAMMRSVGLELATLGAIWGPTILLADEDIFGVEALQTS